MTKNEKRLLRTAITAVAHHNRNAWWDLKREIYEGGYESYYPAQDDFLFPAQRVLEGLPSDVVCQLAAEWRKDNPGADQQSDTAIVASYDQIIVAEVVERARVAAYRTENW